MIVWVAVFLVLCVVISIPAIVVTLIIRGGCRF